MAHPFTLVKETKSLTGFLAHNLTIELDYTGKSSRAALQTLPVNENRVFPG